MWIVAWIQTADPNSRMTEVQREIVHSALMRDDVTKAKAFVRDYLGAAALERRVRI